jgi:hypothetical protein
MRLSKASKLKRQKEKLMRRIINFLFIPLEIIPQGRMFCLTWGLLTGFIFVIILGIGVNFALGSDEPQIAEQSVSEPQTKAKQALIEKWKSLSPRERERLREKHQTLKKMSPEERRRLKENLNRFKNLPPEKQEKLRENWQRIKDLPLEERRVIFNNYRKWQSLSPQEKQRLRQRHIRIQQMPPEKRKMFLEKQRRWQEMPKEEKERFRKRHQIKREPLRRECPKRLQGRPAGRPAPKSRRR